MPLLSHRAIYADACRYAAASAICRHTRHERERHVDIAAIIFAMLLLLRAFAALPCLLFFMPSFIRKMAMLSATREALMLQSR